MKHRLYVPFLWLMFIVFVFSCQDNEFGEPTGQPADTAALLQEARSWYDTNKVPEASLRSSVDLGGNKRELLFKPDWDLSFFGQNDRYEVSQSIVLTLGRSFFVDPKAREMFEQTGDHRYIQSIIYYVYRKDKETENGEGFLLEVIPTVEYLETSGFKPFRKVNYLKRDEIFSGIILYYDLDGQFVNGWGYDKGDIMGAIGDIYEGTGVTTRNGGDCTTYFFETYEEYCYFSYVEGYIDSQNYGCSYSYGGTYTMTICRDTYVDPENPPGDYDGGGGNTGGSGSNPPPPPQPGTESLAEKIFKNSNLQEFQWEKVDKMLKDIIDDCMGSELYNKLVGKEVPFKFGDSNLFGSSSGITLMEDADSDALLHEMFHVYQDTKESSSSWNESVINLEIEAHLAQFMYMNRHPNGSEWMEEITKDKRFMAIGRLQQFVDEKGNIIRGTEDDFDLRVLMCAAAFKAHPEYNEYNYNYDRIGLENINFIRELSKNCG